MPENPASWPFLASILQNNEPLAEYKCSAPDSLITALRPYLEIPGVTITITVNPAVPGLPDDRQANHVAQ